MVEKQASSEIAQSREHAEFFERHPWMIAVVIFGALIALVFIEPVFMHYANAWWKFWLG